MGAPSSTSGSQAQPVELGVAAHFKDGGQGVAAGVTFTVKMLPKLIVAGPPHEIEQAQIECVQGAERGIVSLDTQHKTGEWKGLVFDFGYADVYHNDIVLTVRQK
jgi:hypothetical protein